MQIRVNCSCGKVLKIPEKYAGKKGRCPSCGKKIMIPSAEERPAPVEEKVIAEPPVRNCPTCGCHLNPGDNICVSCRTNLKTGDWDLDAPNIASDPPSSIPYKNIFGVIAALVLGGGIFFTVQVLTTPTAPLLLKVGKPIVPSAISNLENVMDLPETDLSGIKKKINSFSLALDQYLKIPIMKQYQQLRDKKLEFKAQQAYKSLPTENELKHWLALKKLERRYRDTKYSQTLAQANSKVEHQNIKAIQRQIRKAKQLKNITQADVLLQASSWLSNRIALAYPGADLSREIRECAGIFRQAVEGKIAEASKSAEQQAQEQKWRLFCDKMQEALDAYAKKIQDWKFTALFLQVQPLVKEAKFFKEKYPENANIKKLLNVYEDLKLLEQFWHTSMQAMPNTVGSNQVLYLKTHGIESGKIVKYHDKKLYVKSSRNNKIRKIAVMDLAPRVIVNIALQKNKDPNAYLGAATFYRINNKPRECRKISARAAKMGIASEKNVRNMKWAQQILENRKEVLATLQEREKLAKERKAQQIKQELLETERDKAWSIIDKVLLEYRRGANNRVLEYLHQLKKTISKEELSTMSTQVFEKEGQSLTTIAQTVFNYCPHCRNSETGSIKCDRCLGEGYLQQGVGSSDLPIYRESCPKCKGSGEVACPYCYNKRNNRQNIRLLAFYQNL